MIARGKRGVGHIEIVISFAVFMAVILTAFYFYDSTSNTRRTDTNNIYVHSAVESNLTDKIYTYAIKINPSGQAKTVLAIKIDDIGSKNPHVETESGMTIDSVRDGTYVYIDESGNEDFVYLQLSESFENGDIMVPAAYSDADYSILGKVVSEGISESKAENLRTQYISNYENTKRNLGISEDSDFSFSVRSSGSDIETSKNVSNNAEIYVISENRIFIDKEGEEEIAKFEVRTW